MFRQMFSTLIGFLVGTLVGAAFALLWAPRPGMETRQMVMDNLEQYQAKAKMALEDAQSKARQISDISRQVVQEQKASLDTAKQEAVNVIKS